MREFENFQNTTYREFSGNGFHSLWFTTSFLGGRKFRKYFGKGWSSRENRVWVIFIFCYETNFLILSWYKDNIERDIHLRGSMWWRARVVGGHATIGRLSNNDFSTFQAIRNFFEKKSLNGHATVVGGHATVGRLSNNVFWTFQAIWENFEKSRWTVTRQWSEVTRPSADCQTTFLDVSSDLGEFWKKSLNGHATVVEVTRP